MTQIIACLTVTNRPRWIPWVSHQVSKQTYPWTEHVIVDGSQYQTIGEARNVALSKTGARYIAWFDDDDWSHPERLQRAMDWSIMGAGAVGNLKSWLIDSKLGPKCAMRYQGYGHVIFNGALFDRTQMPPKFQLCSQAEDIVWVAGGAQQGVHISIPALQHAWLCHEENIVNKSKLYTFDHRLPSEVFITEIERALIP